MAIQDATTSRSRKAVYSVTEVAARCGISRARFYDLIRDGVMPYPVYCPLTRRPFYHADMAILCQRVKETNTGIDGRYVIFYSRREQSAEPTSTRARPAARPAAADPLAQEMVETLKAMGVRASDADIKAAISARCSGGASEASFEADLRAIFDHLRCRDVG